MMTWWPRELFAIGCELVVMMSTSGCGELNYFNLFGILGWFVNGTLLRKRVLSASQIRFFDKMVPLFIGVERIIPARVGLSLIAVGEKN